MLVFSLNNSLISAGQSDGSSIPHKTLSIVFKLILSADSYRTCGQCDGICCRLGCLQMLPNVTASRRFAPIGTIVQK